MGTTIRQPNGRLRMLAVALLAVAIAAASAIIAGSGARAATAKLVTLGATSSTPNPSCPRDPCQAVGKVTGFQAAAAGRNGLFRAPSNGKVVKWSIRLSKPAAKDIKFFNSFYGSPPKARIAILRRSNTTSPPRYKLLRQSPAEVLTPYFGQGGQTFVLNQPLGAKKDDVVALSIPTWAPAFAVNISSRNVWRAGRAPGKCNSKSDIRNGSAHQGVGNTRAYGCVYRGARLLYTAGFAPN